MNPNERTEYDALFESLCAGLGILCTPPKRESYWIGLSKMSLIQFSRVVDHCLSEQGPEKFPSVPGVWKIWRSVREASRAQAAQPSQAAVDPIPQSWGLMQVNGMFLRYLGQRRYGEQFRGNINMLARRQACLELAQWLDGLHADGMPPTAGERQRAFDGAMARIPDLSADDAWLTNGLAPQRQEDQDRRRV